MDNTGDCFLKDEKFEKWYDIQGLEKDSSPLFVCSGIPGAGKSVMRYVMILAAVVNDQKEPRLQLQIFLLVFN